MGKKDYANAFQSGKQERINHLSKEPPEKLCWLAKLWHNLRLSHNRSSEELAQEIADHEYKGIRSC